MGAWVFLGAGLLHAKCPTTVKLNTTAY